MYEIIYMQQKIFSNSQISSNTLPIPLKNGNAGMLL